MPEVLFVLSSRHFCREVACRFSVFPTLFPTNILINLDLIQLHNNTRHETSLEINAFTGLFKNNQIDIE